MISLLIRELLKKYRGYFEYLAVGEQTIIPGLWRPGLFGMKFSVGFHINRDE
jgi:hypothetical protein